MNVLNGLRIKIQKERRRLRIQRARLINTRTSRQFLRAWAAYNFNRQRASETINEVVLASIDDAIQENTPTTPEFQFLESATRRREINQQESAQELLHRMLYTGDHKTRKALVEFFVTLRHKEKTEIEEFVNEIKKLREFEKDPLVLYMLGLSGNQDVIVKIRLLVRNIKSMIERLKETRNKEENFQYLLNLLEKKGVD